MYECPLLVGGSPEKSALDRPALDALLLTLKGVSLALLLSLASAFEFPILPKS